MIKYIILIVSIIMMFCECAYAYNINNCVYVEQTNNSEVIQVDVGNHNRRSSSRSSSSSSSRRRTKRNSGKTTSVSEIIAKIIVFIIIMSIICIKEIVFSKKNRFLSHKKNVKDKLLEIDSNFSEESFLNYAEKLFMKLNDCWTKREWLCMKEFESEELFEKHNNQINEYIQNKTINCIEDISIKNIFISKCRIKDDYLFVTVKINAHLIDYILNELNGDIVKGDNQTHWNMGYTLIFKKSLNLYSDKWILCEFKGINL